eukprot:Em0001g998a
MERIRYEVHSCSSYCGDYPPTHILVDDPSDSKSRWLSDGNQLPQYLVLKLEVPAIVHSITFGKHERPHPCNLKKVQVFGGMDVAHVSLLSECTLENTSVPETINLTHRCKAGLLASQYIKIVPVQSWGLGLNYSVWYVELKGLTDVPVVQKAISDLEDYKEKEALLLCMKHLRQYGYTEPFASLKDRAGVVWEDPMLTHLYKAIVEDGDWKGAEQAMEQAAEAGHFEEYLCEQPVRVQWAPIEVATASAGDQGGCWPGMRGGHQMCVDPNKKVLYMFGGWDGDQDLGDLWRFDVESGTWECVCSDTSLVGGPCPRSCHKMALDLEEGTMYVLGRYIDHVRALPLPGDFFSYSIDLNSWTLISSDTFMDGGPRLIYDHQMCYDGGTRCLYVFGGKVLTSTPASETSLGTYSGLYVFHTVSKQWTCLKPDYSGGPYPHLLVPRMAHNAIFHPGTHQLIILGGERDKIFVSDMMAYNVLTDETEVLADGHDKQIPSTGFTLRATLDHASNIIYLYTGLCESTSEEARQPSNALWSYDMGSARWTCMYRSNQGLWHRRQPPTPCPRYAHQLVYDEKSHTHYMFGGNPALEKSNKIRLDDFWTLKLVRPSVADVLRRSRHLLRRQRFQEMASIDPMEALSFLKTTLASTVDHRDPDESDQFRQLASTLFNTAGNASLGNSIWRRERMEVYNELNLYFPSHMTQPRSSLVDLISIS